MSVPRISPAELKEALSRVESERPVLLDVRTPKEHAIVSLPGARLIPLHELELRAEELSSLSSRDVVVYCHHGVRSQNAAAFLLSQGIQARSLIGGIDLYAQEADPSLARY